MKYEEEDVFKEVKDMKLRNWEWFPQGLLMIFEDKNGREFNLHISHNIWEKGICNGNRNFPPEPECYGGPFR